MPPEHPERVSVFGSDGSEMVVNADGSINVGVAAVLADPIEEFAEKVMVVGSNGNVLVVNADGSLNGVSV